MKHGSFCFIRSREEFCAVMTCVTELAKRRRQVGVKVDCDFIALCPSLVKKKIRISWFLRFLLLSAHARSHLRPSQLKQSVRNVAAERHTRAR